MQRGRKWKASPLEIFASVRLEVASMYVAHSHMGAAEGVI